MSPRHRARKVALAAFIAAGTLTPLASFALDEVAPSGSDQPSSDQSQSSQASGGSSQDPTQPQGDVPSPTVDAPQVTQSSTSTAPDTTTNQEQPQPVDSTPKETNQIDSSLSNPPGLDPTVTPTPQESETSSSTQDTQPTEQSGQNQTGSGQSSSQDNIILLAEQQAKILNEISSTLSTPSTFSLAAIAAAQAAIEAVNSNPTDEKLLIAQKAVALADAHVDLDIAQQALDSSDKKAQTDEVYDQATALISIAQVSIDSARKDAVAASTALADAVAENNAAPLTSYAQEQLASALLAVSNAQALVTQGETQLQQAQQARDDAQAAVDSATTHGVNAKVYNNLGYNNAPPLPGDDRLILDTTVDSIAFNWGGGPVLNTLYEDVAVKFTGQITSPVSGTISFYAPADDGVILIIDNTTVINDWYDKGGGGSTRSYDVTANTPMNFTLWFYENGGGAHVQLMWNLGNGWQTVPASAYSSSNATPEQIAALATANQNLTAATQDLATAQEALTNAQQALPLAQSNLKVAQDADASLAEAISLIPAVIDKVDAAENTVLSLAADIHATLMPTITSVWAYDGVANITVTPPPGTTTPTWKVQVIAPQGVYNQYADADLTVTSPSGQITITNLYNGVLYTIRIAHVDVSTSLYVETKLAPIAPPPPPPPPPPPTEPEVPVDPQPESPKDDDSTSEPEDQTGQDGSNSETETPPTEEEVSPQEPEDPQTNPEEEQPEEPADPQPEEESPTEQPVDDEETTPEPPIEDKPNEQDTTPKDEEVKNDDPKPQDLIDDIISNAAGSELSNEERAAVAAVLVAAFTADGGAVPFDVLAESGIRAADLPPDTPVELPNGVVIVAEVQAAFEVLADPGELLSAVFSDPGQVLTALTNLGADMSPTEREESQKVVVASVVAAGVAVQAAAAAAATAAASTSSSSSGSSNSGGGAPVSRENGTVRRRTTRSTKPKPGRTKK